MKLPRDLSGNELSQKLKFFGYSVTRQSGRHMRLTTTLNGEHHITIPDHDSLKVGTLSAILDDVASHQKITKEEVIQKIS
ncbi:MAG: type II toxin-antitoxin system HicA family toxin [Methylococcales bacterium]